MSEAGKSGGAPIRTTCPYCGVGCGVLVDRAANGSISVKGDPLHPANFGRLCSKGTALAATMGMEGRLLEPRIGDRQAGWDEAIDHVATRLKECIERHGPESVAFYVSGQLLTEDYYVANKLMKGFIGTANIDTNSRLCMSSAVAGHVRAFGEDIVPVEYTDLEQADLIVLVGSNTAWCHPVLMQRIVAAREQRPQLKLVVIDPRRTATCELADLHLPLRSGSDVLLFNGLLSWLADQKAGDTAFIGANTSGLEQALQAARVATADVPATAQACGLAESVVQQFFSWFGATTKVVTAFSQGVNQSSSGSDKVNSIINCHLYTGRIGQPGMGPFSITGQPNAMGGREVGGLSTQLAAHLTLESPEHRAAVQEFWNSPRIADRAGHKAVELFEAIDAGKVKAVWIMATNPVVSLPDADQVRRALQRCELVIVSDCVADNDTLRYAHVKLPAAAWGEKDGTVTNSDRHVSRQRSFQPLPEAARPDWWIVSAVARRMGFADAFSYSSPAQIFDEHARLTRLSREFGYRLDLQGLAGLDEQGWDQLSPTQWPVGVAPDAVAARQAIAGGRFPTADGRARFVATWPRAPRHATSPEFPLVLNTGRIRDQWHTMTRTARAAALNAHEPEPYLDMHAADLAAAGLVTGEIARLVTRWGASLARVRCSGEMPPGMVFMPIHWSEQFARESRVGAAVNPVVDPVSGEPEFKHTPARVMRWNAVWRGFLLSRQPVANLPATWWAASRLAHCWRYELAGDVATMPSREWLQSLTDPESARAQWIEYQDEAAGSYRAAVLLDGRLEVYLLLERTAKIPARGWLIEQFGQDQIGMAERRSLLRGQPPQGNHDPGPTICACFSVGANAIAEAIRSGCVSVEAVGQRLRAGTNCGSCRPEISRMIPAHVAKPAA
jgi:assimilatory nitrate reductase catalytic subunit